LSSGETLDLFAMQVRDQLRKQGVDERTIQERFEVFHHEHPEVYAELVRLAREWKGRGRARLGIKMLWEVMRWNLSMAKGEQDDFKLNNNFTSRFARMIAEREPDLGGVFEFRALTSEGEQHA
jgi:hypothetical protein